MSAVESAGGGVGGCPSAWAAKQRPHIRPLFPPPAPSSSLRSLGTVLSIVRDVGHLMDSINTSTAVHRLGKVVRRKRDAQPGVARSLMQHPQYRRLVARVEELAPTYQPRGLANTLWGLAGEGRSQELLLPANQCAVGVPAALFDPLPHPT